MTVKQSFYIGTQKDLFKLLQTSYCIKQTAKVSPSNQPWEENVQY